MIETIYSDPDFFIHHGIKGQKWDVRNDPSGMELAMNNLIFIDAKKEDLVKI